MAWETATIALAVFLFWVLLWIAVGEPSYRRLRCNIAHTQGYLEGQQDASRTRRIVGSSD